MSEVFNGKSGRTQPDVEHRIAPYELPLSAREWGEQLAKADSDEARMTLSLKMVERSELESGTPEVVGQELLQGLAFALQRRDAALLRRVLERMQAIVNRGSKTNLDSLRIRDEEIEQLLNGMAITLYVATGTHGQRIMIDPKQRRMWMSADRYGLEYRQNFVRLFKGLSAIAGLKAEDLVDVEF